MIVGVTPLRTFVRNSLFLYALAFQGSEQESGGIAFVLVNGYVFII